jgi:hypothetical protein
MERVSASRTGTAYALSATGLLALDGAGVARQQAEIAQLAAMRLIEAHERAERRQAQCASLPRLPTADEIRADVETPERVGGGERCWMADTSAARGK